MHTSRFVYLLLFAAASQAYAGAGQTSAGVTTTVPTDPTAATQDVQSQSSNFAQQNQALAGTSGATGTTGTIAAVGAAGARPGRATDANGKPIDPNNPSGDPKAAGQKPTAPALPPAPPPEYVSNIKKVDRPANSAAAPTAVAVVEKGASETTQAAPPADVDPSAVTAPGVQRQAVAQKPAPRPAAEPAERTGAERLAPGSGSSGGSGAPPDSYAFYIGLIVAGALLAFAAAMFLRVEKGGAR
jgi:hypothetical protein